LSSRERAFRDFAFALAVVAWVAIATTTAAQTTSENAAQAEALFRDGRTLVKAGRTSEACAKFAESHRLDPQTGTLLNLALCHEEEGKTASAWAEFNEVSERSGKTSERSEFAQRHARAVEARLSKLRINVDSSVPGFSLTLDGRPLRSAALGSLIPLDPGEHTVEATAPGKERWVERVRIDPGPAAREIVVKWVDAPPARQSASSEPAAPPAPPAAAPLPPSTARRDVGLAVGALGIVGIGVGTGFGLSAVSKKDDYDGRFPGGACLPEACDEAADAKRALDRTAIISTVAFGVGALGLVTGFYLVLTSSSSKAPASTVRLSPAVGGPIGLALDGTW
jgi:hypothetical protein